MSALYRSTFLSDHRPKRHPLKAHDAHPEAGARLGLGFWRSNTTKEEDCLIEFSRQISTDPCNILKEQMIECGRQAVACMAYGWIEMWAGGLSLRIVYPMWNPRTRDGSPTSPPPMIVPGCQRVNFQRNRINIFPTVRLSHKMTTRRIKSQPRPSVRSAWPCLTPCIIIFILYLILCVFVYRLHLRLRFPILSLVVRWTEER